MNKGLTGGPKRGHKPGKQDIAGKQAAKIYAIFHTHIHMWNSPQASKVVDGPTRGHKPGKTFNQGKKRQTRLWRAPRGATNQIKHSTKEQKGKQGCGGPHEGPQTR